MTTDVTTGLSRATARLTVSRCPAASCTTPTADGSSTPLGPPGLGTWIVKSGGWRSPRTVIKVKIFQVLGSTGAEALLTGSARPG
jgi:hypothetical protein